MAAKIRSIKKEIGRFDSLCIHLSRQSSNFHFYTDSTKLLEMHMQHIYQSFFSYVNIHSSKLKVFEGK